MTPARWRKVRLSIVWLLSATPFALLFWDTYMLPSLILSCVNLVILLYLFLVFVSAEKRDVDVWWQYAGSFIVLLLAFPCVAPKRILFWIDRPKLEEAAAIVRDTGWLPTTFEGGIQTVTDFSDLDGSECLWIDRGPTGGIGYCHMAHGREAPQLAFVSIPLGEDWYYVIED